MFPGCRERAPTSWVRQIFAQRLTTHSSRALLEKLIVTQLVKKFPTSYGIRKFNAMFTSPVTVPYLEPMNPVHKFAPYFPKIHSNIIPPSRPRSFEWFSREVRYAIQQRIYSKNTCIALETTLYSDLIFVCLHHSSQVLPILNLAA